MWTEVKENDLLLGYSLQRERKFHFFGTRHLKKEDLPRKFPHFEFCFLKQVHGNRVVEGRTHELLEADGHWTKIPGRALVIQTADCLPILLGAKDRVMALHAGWRGIEQNIIGEGLKLLGECADFLIGPHIARESFEVGNGVAEKLLAAINEPSAVTPHANPEKKWINLSALAQRQCHLTSPATTPHVLAVNTYTQEDFASYRRSGGTTERQYSFTVQL